MRSGACVVFLTLLLLSGSRPLSGQATTGALTGTVTQEGQPLAGVTITIASPMMQGTRVTYSYVNGDYNFAAIPPGDYAVTFEMQGMTPLKKTVPVGLARIERVNAAMVVQAIAEAVTVTAAAPTVLETTEVQSNYTAELVDTLPIARTLQAVTQFAPGVTTTQGGTIRIAGSLSYDNLYLINGAVTNDGFWGESRSFFIEDAIQETSVLVGSISAEYGRFTGGVVSAITRSGGNEFSGSFRDSLTNLAWTETSDFGEEKPDSNVDETYEATLGGRIVHDRLWFFLAGRYTDRHTQGFYVMSDIARPTSVETEARAEYKLTGQLNPKHSIIGSWLDLDNEQTNYCLISCWDETSIDPARSVPQHMATARYNGILGSNTLVEAGYSSIETRFHGGTDYLTTDFNDPRDIALGSWAFDTTYGGFWGAPPLCAPCGDQVWKNDYYSVKGTRYLATKDMGTHSIVAGYENFTESSRVNNYQSGSNFNVYIFIKPPEREANGTLRPIVSAGDLIQWVPIPILSEGSNFDTQSLFVNDKWDLGSKWSFNVGARYDENDGRDSAGHPISHDRAVSPRLGVIYDIRGDGRFRVNASYSKYVSKIWEGFGGANGGGNPWYVYYEYRGPTVGGLGSGLDSFAVLEQVFRWFLAQGGTQATDLALGAVLPGVNIRIGDLVSPSTDEWTVGFGSQLGSKGFARIDFIDRTWSDFYTATTTPGDVVESPVIPGEFLDMQTFVNSDDFARTYRAVILQGSFRPADRLSVGGNYTWSQSKGNYGELAFYNSPYPEYKAFPQNNPVGYLATDQTHKARLWASYDQHLGALGSVNLSLLESLESGRPYSAAGNVPVSRYVTNPGYATPPRNAGYFFGDRGEYRWDTVTSTDLAINYELPIRKARLFVQADVLNIFGEQAQISGDDSIRLIAQFNPFTDSPKECPQGQADCAGFNWQKRASFGTAIAPGDYQTPRTYRFSAGVRF
jgi:outer membrane receptor protein involved in Fe transport